MSQRPKVMHNLIKPLLEKGCENEEEIQEVLSSNEVCFDQRSIFIIIKLSIYCLEIQNIILPISSQFSLFAQPNLH